MNMKIKEFDFQNGKHEDWEEIDESFITFQDVETKLVYMLNLIHHKSEFGKLPPGCYYTIWRLDDDWVEIEKGMFVNLHPHAGMEFKLTNEADGRVSMLRTKTQFEAVNKGEWTDTNV